MGLTLNLKSLSYFIEFASFKKWYESVIKAECKCGLCWSVCQSLVGEELWYQNPFFPVSLDPKIVPSLGTYHHVLGVDCKLSEPGQNHLLTFPT